MRKTLSAFIARDSSTELVIQDGWLFVPVFFSNSTVYSKAFGYRNFSRLLGVTALVLELP